MTSPHDPDNEKPFGREPEPMSAGEWGIVAVAAGLLVLFVGTALWVWLS